MDPLSIIASTIAIAGATAQALEALSSIYGASSELHALMNEVSELRIVLQKWNASYSSVELINNYRKERLTKYANF
jgi:hypothetical protein